MRRGTYITAHITVATLLHNSPTYTHRDRRAHLGHLQTGHIFTFHIKFSISNVPLGHGDYLKVNVHQWTHARPTRYEGCLLTALNTRGWVQSLRDSSCWKPCAVAACWKDSAGYLKTIETILLHCLTSVGSCSLMHMWPAATTCLCLRQAFAGSRLTASLLGWRPQSTPISCSRRNLCVK